MYALVLTFKDFTRNILVYFIWIEQYRSGQYRGGRNCREGTCYSSRSYCAHGTLQKASPAELLVVIIFLHLFHSGDVVLLYKSISSSAVSGLCRRWHAVAL